MPILLIVSMVLLQWENARWCIHGLGKYIFSSRSFGSSSRKNYDNVKYRLALPNLSAGGRDSGAPASAPVWARSWITWVRYPVLGLASVYPILYNHEMTFMYINDQWDSLLGVQLGFLIADDACLLLRWLDALPSARAGLRLLHVYFNLGMEADGLSSWSSFARNSLFLLDDSAAILDLLVLNRYSDGRGRRTVRQRIALALAAPALSIMLTAWLAQGRRIT